jgi:serine/threonine protein kinase
MTATKEESLVTERGTILGTFPYMPPEQIEGKELDRPSDIFSLGAVLYEMVTGRRAFEGQSSLHAKTDDGGGGLPEAVLVQYFHILISLPPRSN